VQRSLQRCSKLRDLDSARPGFDRDIAQHARSAGRSAWGAAVVVGPMTARRGGTWQRPGLRKGRSFALARAGPRQYSAREAQTRSSTRRAMLLRRVLIRRALTLQAALRRPARQRSAHLLVVQLAARGLSQDAGGDRQTRRRISGLARREQDPQPRAASRLDRATA